jgi:phosphatidylserine/phosphatidylglycerophosphate/cardiolipin synthase-like enzyme
MSLRRRATSADKRVRRAKASLDGVTAQLREASPRRAAASLETLSAQLRKKPPRKRSASLQSIARALREGPKPTPAERAAMTRTSESPLDVSLPARPISVELVAGRAHYERVISAILAAHTSVWIATANVKGLMVEGPRRSRKRSNYVSVISLLDGLAAKGVELRLLHAELPSGPFRDELAHHPRLVAGGLALARCPRVHLKAVIVDGALLYLGSANWTGAGLGAKGSGKRNFELGIVTDDAPLLDQVQGMFERIWSGGECAGCKLRDVCPGPLDELP